MSPVYSELVKEPNYHVLAQLTTQNVVCFRTSIQGYLKFFSSSSKDKHQDVGSKTNNRFFLL